MGYAIVEAFMVSTLRQTNEAQEGKEEAMPPQATRYQYIHFILKEIKPRTTVWYCLSNSSRLELGIVQWNGPWRQYCFFPAPGCELVFSGGCLANIKDFMERLNSTAGHAGEDDT